MDSYTADARSDLIERLRDDSAISQSEAEELVDEYAEVIRYQLIEQHKITNPAQDR